MINLRINNKNIKKSTAMKRLLYFMLMLLPVAVWGQNGFHYKILLSQNGNILANTDVDLRLTIEVPSVGPVYTETFHTTTDANGIARVVIGTGNTSDDFSAINWSQPYVLHTEVSLDNGSTYTDMGTEPLEYVPYAKWAATTSVFKKIQNHQPAGKAEDTIYHLGPVLVGTTGYTAGLQMAVVKNIDSDDNATGLKVDLTGSGNGNLLNIYNHMDVSGNGGSRFGIYNLMTGTVGRPQGRSTSVSTTMVAGVNNQINVSGLGPHYGVFNTLSQGTGIQIGTYNRLSGNDGLVQMGTENYLDNNNDDEQYGVYSVLRGSGNGYHYGYHAILEGSGGGRQVGYGVYITNSGDENHYGAFYEFNGSGSGDRYGVYNTMHDDGTGTHYGVYNRITTDSDMPECGVYNYVSGNGTGNKYGEYIEIPSSSGGTHYGIFSRVLALGDSYAGYFDGNVKITHKLKTDIAGDADLKPYVYGSVGNAGQIDPGASSDGFTVTYNSGNPGVYRINMPSIGPGTYVNYTVTVSVETNNGTPYVAVVDKYGTYFYVYIYDLNGQARSADFDFVVYRK